MNVYQQLSEMNVGDIQTVEFTELARSESGGFLVDMHIVCVPGGWIIEDVFVPRPRPLGYIVDEDELV